LWVVKSVWAPFCLTSKGYPDTQLYCVTRQKFTIRILTPLLSVNPIHKRTNVVLAHGNEATKGNEMDKNFTCHEVW